MQTRNYFNADAIAMATARVTIGMGICFYTAQAGKFVFILFAVLADNTHMYLLECVLI